MTARRYAEGTTVAVETTQAEMRSLLKKHGASEFGLYEGPARQAVQFTLSGHPYRFDVEMPTDEWADGETSLYPYHRAYKATIERKKDAEWRRRWRARLIWLKATLEFASGENGDSLPWVLGAFAVLPSGQTLGQALEAGAVPLLGAGS
jgi:hypothetical protein